MAAFGRGKEFVAGVFLAVITLSNVVVVPGLLPFLRSGYQNFTIFYTAGKMVRSGQTAALYDLSVQYQAQQQFAPDVRIRQAALPYNHPPFEALLFVPFTFFGYWTAYLFWTALNIILLAASLAVLTKQFAEVGNLSSAFLGLAAAGFFPVVSAIIQGQDCILLLFFYVIALAAFEKEQDVIAGAVLAAGLFRFQLVLPLVLILAVRRWRLLVGFAPVAGLLAGVSVAMIGWRGAFDYVWLVLSLEKSGAVGSIVAVGMPNLRGIIAGMPGVDAGSKSVVVLTFVCSIIVAVMAMWRIRTGRDSARCSFALATVAAVLVSYHALTYDLSLLLPSMLLLFSAPGMRAPRETQADIMLLVLLFLIPRFELLGHSLSPLGWFALLLVWLLGRLSRGQTAPGDFACSSLGRSRTIPSMGR
ncbi:MAG: glycosyltransferase family 87 protein [Terriglobales bacterium]